MKENITLEINSVDIEVEVEFDYTPAVMGRLNALPENCHPSNPEIFELNGLDYDRLDLSALLSNEEIVIDIINQLKEAE